MYARRARGRRKQVVIENAAIIGADRNFILRWSRRVEPLSCAQLIGGRDENLLARLLVAIRKPGELIQHDHLVGGSIAAWPQSDLLKLRAPCRNSLSHHHGERANEMGRRLVDEDFELQ